MADQILSLQAKAPAPRYNPKPPGAIQEGSASDLVLRLLSDQPQRWWTCEQIISTTGRTHAAISFALLYLREQRLITSVPDLSRNQRYLRYRAMTEEDGG